MIMGTGPGKLFGKIKNNLINPPVSHAAPPRATLKSCEWNENGSDGKSRPCRTPPFGHESVLSWSHRLLPITGYFTQLMVVPDTGDIMWSSEAIGRWSLIFNPPFTASNNSLNSNGKWDVRNKTATAIQRIFHRYTATTGVCFICFTTASSTGVNTAVETRVYSPPRSSYLELLEWNLRPLSLSL